MSQTAKLEFHVTPEITYAWVRFEEGERTRPVYCFCELIRFLIELIRHKAITKDRSQEILEEAKVHPSFKNRSNLVLA